MKKFFLLIIIVLGLSAPVFCASEKELFESGLDFLQQDRYQEAVDTFTQLIDVAPENPHAYRNRGVAYMKLNLYDKAINDFQRTKEIVPDLKGLHSNLGVAWYYKKNYSRAIKNYDREISLSPDNYFAYFNRAICWAVLEDYEKSFSDIIKTIELLPDFYLAFCLKGDLLVKMNRPRQAKQVYEDAISIDPDQTYAKEQLASLKLDSGPVEKGDPAQVPVPDKKQEDRPAQKIQPKTIKKKLEKTTSPVLPNVPGNYRLQVGAYQVRSNAMAMQKKLEEKGYEAIVLELTRPNKVTWFLVRVGTYPLQGEAAADKYSLKNDLGIDAIVKPTGQF